MGSTAEESDTGGTNRRWKRVVIIFGLKRLEHVYPTASVASEEIQALRYHIRRDE